MGKKMKNAPVYFTLAQVRFNPILNMDSYLPTIQEKMRIAHFPAFKRETIQQLVLQLGPPGDGSQSPPPSFVPQARCLFGTVDRATEFVLEHSALALHTTAYDSSDKFFKQLLDGLAIINDTLRLDFTERVGLRYFDAVLPKAHESLAAYLTPEVLGLSDKFEGKLSHSYSETVTMNTNGKLVSRVIIQNGQVGLPPEIATLEPQINPKFTEPVGRHAILDTDAFYEQREPFSLERLNSKLISLHTEIKKSFDATITAFARKAWA